jgi:hypothetical protein
LCEPNQEGCMEVDQKMSPTKSAVMGTGSSRNQPLMAGNTLTVEGMLDAKGTYGLVHVFHQWAPQGYINLGAARASTFGPDILSAAPLDVM